MSEDAITHHSAGPTHQLERLIFFSDAVFAIAITLLVIDLHLPRVPRHASDLEFLQALADLTPNFIGFVVSFAVIGAFWTGHHRAFALSRHWSPRLFVPNLLLLGGIAAMPFFTAFSAEYAGERVPVALYCGSLAVIALLGLWVERLATSPSIAGPDADPQQRRLLLRGMLGVLMGALTALVISLWAPVYGQIALISIAPWRWLLRRLP